MKNIVFFNHLNWIINTLLVDHPEITLRNISEISFGYCKNINIKDYFALLTCRRLLIALINNDQEKNVKHYYEKINVFTKRENQLIELLFSSWFNNKKIFVSNETAIELVKKNKITLNEYIKTLNYREVKY